MMPPSTARLLLPLAFALGLSSAASGQPIESREAIALQNQIAELRRDIASLRDRVASAGAAGSSLGGASSTPRPSPSQAPPGDLAATLLERVAIIEEELRTLRGRVETQGNALERLTADTRKGLDDLDFRLQQMATPTTQGGAGARPPAQGAAPGQARPQTQGALPVPPAQPNAPAQGAARPTPEARQEALFTEGERLFARREFTQAALVFDDAYRAQPMGRRAAESRIRTGEALLALNERTAACQAFDGVASQFSDMRAELRTRVSQGRSRANCR